MEERLRRGFREVGSPEHADRVLSRLEGAAGERRDEDVREGGGPRPPDRASRNLLVVAEEAARDEEPRNEAVDAAVEAAARANEEGRTGRGRTLLQEALLRRLRFADRVDTRLFLLVNGLPHTPRVDGFFARLSGWMTGGHAWALVPLAVMLGEPSRGGRALVRVMPAVWLTTALLEYPIKRTFRRKRPFIATVRAIVVGRKPGSYSFPSGHSAAAAAGAMALSTEFPRLGGALWLVAGLVKFSRVYLGAHYPGDVVTGALVGALVGRFVRAGVARLVR